MTKAHNKINKTLTKIKINIKTENIKIKTDSKYLQNNSISVILK